jgi:hypothetical protein
VESKKESLLVIQLEILEMEYSPCERYVVAIERWNVKQPTENLWIICTKTGVGLAKFQWQNSAKEAIKSIRFSEDDRHVIRLVPAAVTKGTNSIEVFTDGRFDKPTITLSSKFEHRNAKSIKKGTPGEIIDTHFAGFDLCCLNPALQP